MGLYYKTFYNVFCRVYALPAPLLFYRLFSQALIYLDLGSYGAYPSEAPFS